MTEIGRQFKKKKNINESLSRLFDCAVYGLASIIIAYIVVITPHMSSLIVFFFFFSFSHQANWYKAAQYCRFHGMHLASISSQEDNDRLEKHVNDFGE